MPYRPVLTHPVLRRVLPGFAVSYLGDGMSAIAVTWLAIELAPAEHRATWVALAVTAYTAPGVLGAMLLGRLLRGRPGAQLTAWDATLRGAALGAIPVAALFGVLSIGLYVALLAVSSVLHTWGSAGKFTMIAELLPARHHLAANAVLSTMAETATVFGPVLAGVLIAHGDATLVIGLDAATFAVLAVSCYLVRPTAATAAPLSLDKSGAGLRIIRDDPRLLGLLTLTFLFFLLYGPVQVALPVLIAEAGGSATGLAAYWTAFGIGAMAGGLVAGYLRRWRLWPTTIGIVLGWGCALLPPGLGAPTAVAVVSFGIGGLIYGPYLSTTMALFQGATTTDLLPQVLAARGAILLLSAPLGALMGGPLVAAFSARGTLLLSALATLALGMAAALTAVLGRSRRDRIGAGSRG